MHVQMNRWHYFFPQPLRDPREVKMEAERDAIRASLDIDHQLKELHGALAFKEFVASQKPNSRMPKVRN